MRETDFYFSTQDHAAMTGIASHADTHNAATIYNVTERLGSLQQSLSRRIFAVGSDLQPVWDRPLPVSNYSFSTNGAIDGLTAAFVRPRSQAAMIEKMMGRGTSGNHVAEPYRHPILELRITADHIAVELIMSPYAWWDQRNFVGKLRVERHRDALRSLLCDAQDSFYLGFWSGESLSDVHLSCRQLLRGRFLEEWFGTFAAEHDWFRIGVWYEPDHRTMSQDNILAELSRRAVALTRLYSFFAWTSENNFHSLINTGRPAAQSGYASA